jgi:hypothetical protein
MIALDPDHPFSVGPMNGPEASTAVICWALDGTSQKGGFPSLQWGVRERQDSAQKQPYANIADSSIASAISGISGVGEKPSSAGARTA